MDKGFDWLERWFTNKVDEKATPPKATLIEEKAIKKGSTTLDPSKPNESLQQFKLFLEGREGRKSRLT